MMEDDMYTVDYTTYTNKGKREVNEDSCGVASFRDSYCFVVADGLGGHGGGDVASKCAVDAVCGLFSQTGYTEHFFRDAFQNAQRSIIAAQQQAHTVSQMKTTLVILVVTPGRTYWAHVGDSRLYHWKNQKLRERTVDHSVPQMLVMSGEIKESEIRHHPDRNRLLRVLGVKGEQPRYECGKPLRNSGDHTYLLCTDGYWELIAENAMTEALKSGKTLEEWIIHMNSQVLHNGANTEMDNYTAIAVHVKAKSLLGF